MIDVFPQHAPDHRRDQHEAYTRWFTSVAWDHIATLTFAEPSAVTTARAQFERKYIRHLEKRCQRRIDYAGAVERGSAGGRTHIHVLLAGTAALSPTRLRKAWLAGWPEIKVYRPDLSGAAYLTKTLHEPDSELLLRDRRLMGR